VSAKERPILFSGAMVRAILDGRKTQTRRVVSNQPPANTYKVMPYNHPDPRQHFYAWVDTNPPGPACEVSDWCQPCPYGQSGDRLWVRESWCVGKPHDERAPRDILPHALARDTGVTVLYQAGGWRSLGPAGRDEPVYSDDEPMPDWAGKGRPSIHMPRALSRIALEITGVRVERLNDCSSEDAIAEGISPYKHGWERRHPDPNDISHSGATADPRLAYKGLWESINGTGSWDTNPWVWVVEFRRVEA